MLEFFKPFWDTIVKYGSIVGALFVFWLSARKSGEENIKQQNAEQSLSGVKVRDKIQDDIINSGDDKLSKLRKKWER